VLLLLTSRNFDRQSLKGTLRASRLKLKKDTTLFDKHLDELEAELMLIESEDQEAAEEERKALERLQENNNNQSSNAENRPSHALNSDLSFSSSYGGIEYNAELAEQRTMRKTTRQRQIAAKFLLNILEDEEEENESAGEATSTQQQHSANSNSQAQFSHTVLQPSPSKGRQPLTASANVGTNSNPTSARANNNITLTSSTSNQPVRPVLRRVVAVPETTPFQPGPDFRRQRTRSRSFG
jgi:hypothetical protein